MAPPAPRLLGSTVLLLLYVAHSAAAAVLSWEGEYYDPDELKITLTRSGSSLLAHSADWEISGTLTSDTSARLAGLEGLLTARGVSWSNGVVWSRKAVLAPLAPPTWSGMWHGQRANIDIRMSQPSDTKVVAEGMRCEPPCTRLSACARPRPTGRGRAQPSAISMALERACSLSMQRDSLAAPPLALRTR
jgi:hypothetical protein